MKKAKIFIILFLIILFGSLVAGSIVAWPLLVKLAVPWVTLVNPYKVLVFGGLFFVFSLYVGEKKWKLWIKVTVEMLALSGISLLCGVGLPSILSHWLYISSLVIMMIITLINYLSNQNKAETVSTSLSELGDYSGTVKGCSGYFFNFRGQKVDVENKVEMQKVGNTVSVSFIQDGHVLTDSGTGRVSRVSSESDIPREFILTLGNFGEIAISEAKLSEVNYEDGVLNTVTFKI